MRALVIIDVQEEFLGREGLCPPRAAYLQSLSLVLEQARQMRLCIVHVRTVLDRPEDALIPHFRQLAAPPCMRGSIGAQVPAQVVEKDGEICIEKRGYSAFDGTLLQRFLKEQGVTSLLLAGLYTHACVRETAMDAVRLGWHTELIEQGCGTTQPLHAEGVLRWLRTRGVQLNSALAAPPSASDNWLQRWQSLQHVRLKWEQLGQAERTTTMQQLLQELQISRQVLESLLVEEIFKPRRQAQEELDRALGHVTAAIELFDSAEQPLNEAWSTHWQSRGTVLAITPWNNPIALVLSKLVPALIFGNNVLWKPSPRTPKINAALLGCFERCLMLGQLVQVLPTSTSSVREACEKLAPQVVSITGSESAGMSVAALAQHCGAVFQAELGGNNAAILADGADLNSACRWCVQSAFAFSGQRCTALRRVIYLRARRDDVLRALLDALSSLRAGDPARLDVDYSHVIDRTADRRLRDEISRAQSHGAQVLVDGRASSSDWLGPCIVEAETASLSLVQEESFGPILVLQPARDFDEALQLHNQVRQGLVGTLFSDDCAEQRAFAEHARVGTLRINPRDHGFHPFSPFSGRGVSSLGPAEHGVFDRELYAQPQARQVGLQCKVDSSLASQDSTRSSANCGLVRGSAEAPWDPIGQWRERARAMLSESRLAHYAPDEHELACYRRLLEGHMLARATAAAASRERPRLLVLGATPELAAVGQQLGYAVTRVDVNREMFDVAARRSAEFANARYAQGQGEEWRDIVGDWRELVGLTAEPFDAVVGDAALNNIRHAQMLDVLEQLRMRIAPSGIAIFKQIVLPNAGLERGALSVAEVVKARDSGLLTAHAYRAVLRFGTFASAGMHASEHRLDARLIFEAVTESHRQGLLSRADYAQLQSSQSTMSHTVYTKEQQLRLLRYLGEVHIETASSALHHETILPFFVVRV